jgi:hypothetical protein
MAAPTPIRFRDGTEVPASTLSRIIDHPTGRREYIFNENQTPPITQIPAMPQEVQEPIPQAPPQAPPQEPIPRLPIHSNGEGNEFIRDQEEVRVINEHGESIYGRWDINSKMVHCNDGRSYTSPNAMAKDFIRSHPHGRRTHTINVYHRSNKTRVELRYRGNWVHFSTIRQ